MAINARTTPTGIEFYDSGSPGTAIFKIGNDGACEFGTGTVTFGGTAELGSSGITDADLVVESLNPMTFKLNDTDALQIDDSVISGFAAATDTKGNSVYIETEDAGPTATQARLGGLYNLKTGDGSASTGNFAGGAGGDLDFVTGGGGANAGGATGQAGGAGGAMGLTTGAGGATDDTGSDNGGAGGAMTLTTGAGAASSAGSGDGGAGGAFTVTLGAGAATVAGASGIGGAFSSTSGAGAASSVAFAGGAGGASSLTSGAGGASTGIGSSGNNGGAGGAIAITGGVGGLCDDDGAGQLGGAGASITLTAGAGGLASAGTAAGGSGGDIILASGTGGTSSGGAAGDNGNVISRGQTFLQRKLDDPIGAAATISTAELLGGIIVATPTGDGDAYTTPTGAQISALFGTTPTVGDSFELTIVNIAATNKTVELTAGASGMTVTGEATIENVTDGVAAGVASSGTFIFVNTGADTWVAYRK